MPTAFTESQAMDQAQIAFVSTSEKTADFGAMCQAVTLRTTADVHIAFDRSANNQDFLLKAGDGALEMSQHAMFTKISAIGDTTGGTLYIIARR